jgi:uncharacterized membrane protein YtjA (UPF0391 family)
MFLSDGIDGRANRMSIRPTPPLPGVRCCTRRGQFNLRLRLFAVSLQLVASRMRDGHPLTNPTENVMLYYAAVFFIIAIVAALFGFGGIAAGASSIAQVLFFIFVVLFLVSLVSGLLRRKG